MTRFAASGQFLTDLLQFPSDWRVTGVEYDAETDVCTVTIAGPPEVPEEAEVVVTKTAGAVVYTIGREFLGARETSRYAFGGNPGFGRKA